MMMTKSRECEDKAAEMSIYKRVLSGDICRRMSASDKVVRKYRRALVRKAEYVKLKAMVPAVAHKKSVNKVG